MIVVLFLVAMSGAYWGARLAFRDKPDMAPFASPALLVAAWTVVVVVTVRLQVPLKQIWLWLWLATLISAVSGIGFALRDRRRIDRLLLASTIGASLVLMAPYVVHGIATFPGSYFWDGFAYMAVGEGLWLYPRFSAPADLELFYQFGQSIDQSRYISSSFIVLMKGIFPIGGDAQGSIGYFLMLCIFTFASSCAFLAKAAMPNHRAAQIAFVAVATISGPLLNLVWANNYDHLLATSVAPVLVGMAFVLRWGRATDAVLFSLFSAVLLFIYPEMAAIFAMPACLVLFVRLAQEPRSLAQAKTAAIIAAALAVLIVPIIPELSAFLKNQMTAATNALSAETRPGNGYFPTFFSGVCGPAAWFGLFNPYARCDHNFSHYVKFAVSVACWATLIAAIFSWRKNLGLIISGGVITMAGAFFLVVQRYDYGAFKIVESGWVPLLLLATLGACDTGKIGKRTSAVIAIALVSISVSRVASFERWVTERSITPFAQLQEAVPPGSTVEVRVEDSLAFEWATYFLRNQTAVYTKGELLYFPARQVKTSDAEDRRQHAQYIISDKLISNKSIWSNGKFYLFEK